MKPNSVSFAVHSGGSIGRVYARARRYAGDALAYVVLLAAVTLMGAPLLWMLSTALKAEPQVLVFPPKWIPDPVLWSNFPEALRRMNFLEYLKNSVILTAGGVLGVLFSSAVVGYGFARLQFPGRTPLFILVVSTMMLPPQVTMIPQFILFKYLGWINTFRPMVVPAFLGSSAFNIFLMRQFFLTLPREYDDAARVDGCNTFQIFWHIGLPLAKPGLLTVGIFSFMYYWNEFLQPLIYLSSIKKWPLALGLSVFKDRFAVPQWSLVMAASLVTIAPCLLLFFVTQRYVTRGVAIGGLKQ